MPPVSVFSIPKRYRQHAHLACRRLTAPCRPLDAPVKPVKLVPSIR
eukprot:SAG11_NODE_3127_length_2665_cov_3.141465_4_plen_45_part_01